MVWQRETARLSGGGGSQERTRLRQYFPDTMAFAGNNLEFTGNRRPITGNIRVLSIGYGEIP